MKSSETREIVVGLLTIALFAAVLAGSYGARHVDPGAARDQRRLHAVFNRVDGLAVGDRVYVSGLPVGTVAAMALQPDYRALITLSVSKAVALPSDTAVAVHTDGLFGSKHVVLDPGGSDDLLADGDHLTYTQDSLIVSELLELIIAEGRAARSMPPAEGD